MSLIITASPIFRVAAAGLRSMVRLHPQGQSRGRAKFSPQLADRSDLDGRSGADPGRQLQGFVVSEPLLCRTWAEPRERSSRISPPFWADGKSAEYERYSERTISPDAAAKGFRPRQGAGQTSGTGPIPIPDIVDADWICAEFVSNGIHKGTAADPDDFGTLRPRNLAVDYIRLVHPRPGRYVRYYTAAADVIHSWNRACLRREKTKNAVPGPPQRRLVPVDEPGVYYGQCSELFCGVEHAYMPIEVRVRGHKDQFRCLGPTDAGRRLMTPPPASVRTIGRLGAEHPLRRLTTKLLEKSRIRHAMDEIRPPDHQRLMPTDHKPGFFHQGAGFLSTNHKDIGKHSI